MRNVRTCPDCRLIQQVKAEESGPRHHTDDDAAEAEHGHDCAEAGQHVQAVLSAAFHRQNNRNVRPWTPTRPNRLSGSPSLLPLPLRVPPAIAVAGPVLLRHRLHESWHGLVKGRSHQRLSPLPYPSLPSPPGAACPLKRPVRCTTRHLR